MAAAVSPTMLAVLTIGVGALILGIMIGMYTMPLTLPPEVEGKVAAMRRLTREYYRPEDDQDPVYRALIDSPSTESLKTTLSFLSFQPHQAGTEADESLAKYFRDSFLAAGLDRAYLLPYRALLSYADRQRPNKVYLVDLASKETLLVSGHLEPPIAPDEMHPGAVPAYHAFSPAADVRGQPVYVNYGREADFQLLEEAGRVDPAGKICLMRYGKLYRGNKVENGARHGCLAVILFSDPSLVAPIGSEGSIYPNGVWMNGKAMQRGNVGLVSGDALTVGFPAIEGGFRHDRTDGEHVRLPTIPSQPIGYEDARAILEQMGGTSTSSSGKFQDWSGSLNITYRLGPGFATENRAIRMVINNELVERTIYNVVGVLDGALEADRYVVAGNHRDAWGFGAMDAASGGAALLEAVKAIGGHHRRTGWRPRRSLVFASWSGEEQGLIGSTEFVEEFAGAQLMGARAVAYINADTCVSGPVLRADASPTLMEALRAATRRVPAHPINPEEEKEEGETLKANKTLYDSWAESLAAERKEENEGKENDESQKLKIDLLSSGSDQVPFTFWAGVPSINVEFKPDKKKQPVPSYPAYHTAYETFNLVAGHVDPAFRAHQSCARLLSVLLYSLSSATLLPARFDELAEQLQADYGARGLGARLRARLGPAKETTTTADEKNGKLNEAIDLLEASIVDFGNASTAWHQFTEKASKNFSLDPLLVRSINDVSVQVEKVFTSSSGAPLYGRPDTRNLLLGTPASDFYTTVFFPGLHDLLEQLAAAETIGQRRNGANHEELRMSEAKIRQLTGRLRRHLSEITVAFRAAVRLMRPRPI